MPNLVEANVLSSKSIKLRWTISYAPEREIIDGFFVGYRSLEAQTLDGMKAQQVVGSSGTSGQQQQQQQGQMEQPTFTYKTIRLSAASQQQQQQLHQKGGLVLDNGAQAMQVASSSPGDHQSALLSPISSVTKTVPPQPTNAFNLANLIVGHHATSSQMNLDSNQQQQQQQAQQQQVIVVVSTFEYVITGLERNTEYTILIQCFNKKGAGPTSDPIVFKTFSIDPPDKLLLLADDITESSLRLSWRFAVDSSLLLLGNNQNNKPSEPPVDGYVLTFARITPQAASDAQLTQAAARLPIKSQQNAVGTLDSPAARISQANPMLPSSSGENSINQHQWQAIQLAPQQRSHQLKNLECGSSYAMKIWAFNKIGRGEPSDTLNVRTRGKGKLFFAGKFIAHFSKTIVD